MESPTTTSLEKALVWHLDESDCQWRPEKRALRSLVSTCWHMHKLQKQSRKNQTCYFLHILFLLEFHDDNAIFPTFFVTKAWRQRLKAACGSWQQSGILSHGKMLQMWKGDIHFTGLLQPATDLQKKPAMRTKVPMRLVTQNTGAIKCFQRATTFAVRFCRFREAWMFVLQDERPGGPVLRREMLYGSTYQT